MRIDFFVSDLPCPRESVGIYYWLVLQHAFRVLFIEFANDIIRKQNDSQTTPPPPGQAVATRNPLKMVTMQTATDC